MTATNMCSNFGGFRCRRGMYEKKFRNPIKGILKTFSML